MFLIYKVYGSKFLKRTPIASRMYDTGYPNFFCVNAVHQTIGSVNYFSTAFLFDFRNYTSRLGKILQAVRQFNNSLHEKDRLIDGISSDILGNRFNVSQSRRRPNYPSHLPSLFLAAS